MKKNKFSIIIPVYNTSKYLEKCLNSVINQTYDNYEIITVNDGSTDSTEEILIKNNISHIKLIENLGIINTLFNKEIV